MNFKKNLTENLTRRDFLKASAAGLGTLFCQSQLGAHLKERKRPNILFVLTDDQRFDMLGCAGNPIIKTPNIDRLAQEGVRFEQAFVTTPICAASRASIFTGTYERTHTYTFTKPPLTRAFTDISYPALLREAGYQVGFVGKFGVKVEEGVINQMFDYMRPTSFPYFQTVNGVQRHITELEGEYAVDFLRQIKPDRPFCLVWCPWAPHADDGNPEQYFWPPEVDSLYREIEIPVPEMADPKYYEAQPEFLKNTMNRTRWFWRFDTPEKYQKMVKGYYRMISGVDLVLGRILAELKCSGLDKNTVIIFSSDNGYFLGERGYAGKWLMYDLSIKVPLIIYDPRAQEGSHGLVRKELVLNIDIPATILDLAGLPVPEKYQGLSLRPLLKIGKTDWRKEIFCEELWDNPEIPQSECVRTDRWKYIQYPRHPEYVELFDLKADPQEKHNLASLPQYQSTLEELRRHCQKWIQRLVEDRKKFQ
ncbi:MAG: sulfatase [Candidatus Aminicenantes bacterium]|nr:sulfatase [Candidatus Aminicenantes bacterium]